MSSASSLFIRNANILLPNGEFLIGDVETRGGKLSRLRQKSQKMTLVKK
nr:hypothetical protein [Trichocoleus sp. FACHB-90]